MNARQFFYEFGKMLYKVDSFYAEFAKESGVKAKLLWVLYALNDGKPHSQKEICETWELPRTTVNTIIKELEAKHLVELSQIKGEKREMHVSLTQSGKQYAEEKLVKLYEIESRVFENLTEETKQVIQNMEIIVTELKKA